MLTTANAQDVLALEYCRKGVDHEGFSKVILITLLVGVVYVLPDSLHDDVKGQ